MCFMRSCPYMSDIVTYSITGKPVSSKLVLHLALDCMAPIYNYMVVILIIGLNILGIMTIGVRDALTLNLEVGPE